MTLPTSSQIVESHGLILRHLKLSDVAWLSVIIEMYIAFQWFTI